MLSLFMTLFKAKLDIYTGDRKMQHPWTTSRITNTGYLQVVMSSSPARGFVLLFSFLCLIHINHVIAYSFCTVSL